MSPGRIVSVCLVTLGAGCGQPAPLLEPSPVPRIDLSAEGVQIEVYLDGSYFTPTDHIDLHLLIRTVKEIRSITIRATCPTVGGTRCEYALTVDKPPTTSVEQDKCVYTLHCTEAFAADLEAPRPLSLGWHTITIAVEIDGLQAKLAGQIPI